MRRSIRLRPSLLALAGTFLFLSLAGCSPTPETPPKTLEISADDTMNYSVAAFEVRPGQRISITLTNKGTTLKTAGGHDLVVLQKNTNVSKFLEAASMEAIHDYVAPGSKKDVLASTKLLGPGDIHRAVCPCGLRFRVLIPRACGAGNEGCDDGKITPSTTTRRTRGFAGSRRMPRLRLIRRRFSATDYTHYRH
jgi:azurin